MESIHTANIIKLSVSVSYIAALLVGGIILRTVDPFSSTSAFLQGSRCIRLRCENGNARHNLQHSLQQCMQPWTNATINYSGANAYVEAHYRNHPLVQPSSWMKWNVPYFNKEKASGEKIREPIYNARELQALERRNSHMSTTMTHELSESRTTPSPIHISLLEKYGMTLVESPTEVIDWKDRKQIEDVYIQELERILPTLFSSEVEMHCFWNPMLRGEHLKLSPARDPSHHDDDKLPISTANIASAVHIDTDVGAYDSLDDFLAIVEANEVKRRGDLDAKPFDRKRYQTAIVKDRKRFAIVNFWRSTNHAAPVTTSPLAILSTQYDDSESISASTKENDSNNNRNKNLYDFTAFPTSRPDLEQSKWYTFPNMTSDEVLVFYQFDRLGTQPSDLWHCAIRTEKGRPDQAHSNIECKTTQVARESFDIRALLVFDEVVHRSKDRFHPERLRPVLSFEESGCFCDEQAIKNKQNKYNESKIL